MKLFLVIVLLSATIWDVFTTAYGTIQVLGFGPFQIAASILFSALIAAFVINTARILRLRQGFVGVMVKFFWIIALAYDFYTSWIGNAKLVTQGRGDAQELILLVGLTLLVIASPILLSAVWQGRLLGNPQHQPST
ncbi:MAG: hypothetical protein KDI79_22845 [Anaerolineae bacterium]|nr:hypothetical protein [Anaerolineae bacterium]